VKLGLLFFCGGARVTVHSPSGLIYPHISAPLADEDEDMDADREKYFMRVA
jgi:hypothetical protein